MPAPWKFVCGSAVGTSHQRFREPCQDYAHGRVVPSRQGPVLVAACADGAGSALHPDLGARIACTAMVRQIAEGLESGLTLPEIDARLALGWHEKVRDQLRSEADLRGVGLREFACTLLTAVVGDGAAVFTQIGDGAIVLRDEGALRVAFWPQSGEYASMTFFLTCPDYGSRLAFAAHPGRVEELALFTDGLQPLALHYATQSVYAPFFEPMFQTLRAAPAAEELEGPLQDFLLSPAVNERTDDDKTLFLATR